MYRFCVSRWFRRYSKRRRILPYLPIVALFVVGTSFVGIGNLHLRASVGGMEAKASHLNEFKAPPETTNKDSSTNTKPSSSQSSSVTDHGSHAPPESIGACHELKWWKPHEDDHHRNNPVWVASFPGSGAEMVRQLVSALTGNLEAWSVYDKDNPIRNTTCLEANAATCKTHWPVLKFKPVLFPNQTHDDRDSGGVGYHSRAIVLLRNPATAYPSRMFHQWERNNRVGYHVREANEKAWNRWIANEFGKQQTHYRDFVTTWARLAREKRVALVVPYEELIDPGKGPLWTRRMVEVLHEAGTRHAALEDNASSVACLWRDAVVDRPSRKRAPHTYQPGFRREQHQQLIALLADLVEGLGSAEGGGTTEPDETMIPQRDLAAILRGYHRFVRGNESVRILP